MDNDRYNTLVESIYDAALDPMIWEAAITNLRLEFNPISVGFFIQKSGMFQNRCCKQDYRLAMVGNLVNKQDNLLSFTFFRSRKVGRYANDEIGEYRSLYHHLLKAMAISSRIRHIENKLSANEAALNKLRLGVVFLDGNGRIMFLNEHAKKLFAIKDNGIYIKESRLSSRNRCNLETLNVAIKNALVNGTSSIITLARPLQSALSINIFPSTRGRCLMLDQKIIATVFIADPDDRNASDTEYLTRRWKLSPLEAQFTCYLLQGSTIRQVADLMKLTISTAQWYSKQVMRKLGVNRQSELVIKLMNDLSSFMKNG